MAGLVPAVLVAGLGASSPLALSTSVVVSQVYGGGGNTAAPYANDYVELFNRGSATVSLSGWSLQYASAAGTGNLGASSGQLSELSGSLAPGQHLLVAEASGGAVGAPLPTPDLTDATPINMSATAGKVALVSTTTPLGCNGGSTPCPPAALATIVDLVGYGATANFFEGSGPAAAPSNTTAVLRSAAGCAETDDNAADFTAGAPNPRNTATASTPCLTDSAPAASSTSPANGASGVAVDAGLAITFSEPVDAAGAWFSISCASSGAHTATVSGGPETFTLDPDTDFAGGETCTTTIHAGQVTDQDTDDPPDAMAGDFTFSFTTVLPLTQVHDIQGDAHSSPKIGQSVRTEGIVTARRATGFYLQGTSPDASDATSEGIFVFTSSAPAVAVGDAVSVTGTVVEFRPGGLTSTNLTTTELSGPSIAILSSGNPLPAPVVIGAGGRVPPDTVIEDDAAVVGPTSDFGSNRELPVVGDNGIGAALRTARGGIVIRAGDFNPERIILNDLIDGGPTFTPVDVGDSFPGPTVGVIDYSFGNFKLEVASLPTRLAGGLVRETAAPAGTGQLSFATFNVENLDPGDPPSKFATLAGLIVSNLGSPDLISLEEVQDDDGATDDGVVDATTTFSTLIAAIQTAGGPAYSFRQIDPVNDQDGGQPGGNIRVGFLFRTDRGLSFVDRPGGTPTAAVSVVGEPAGPRLSFSPGRIDPANAAFTTSRKPLAGEFSYDGGRLFVIANHWNSKGGDQPLFGRFQPPVLSSEVQRKQQAQVVHEFVASILALDPSARIVVLGDLNDFEFSSALATLKGSPAILSDLITGLPPAERYSYVFEGNSQTLDHVLMSSAAAARLARIDAVHVNAEFAVQASDHDPLVATACADVTAPSLSVSASPSVLSPPNHKYVTVTVTATVTDSVDPSPAVTFVSATSSEPDDAPGGADGSTTDDVAIVNGTTFKLRAERSETGSGRVYTLTYRATDACGNSTTRSALVRVPLA